MPRGKTIDIQALARTRFKRREVLISEEMIRDAIPRNSSHCMIAEALKKELGVKSPSVDLATIRFTDPAANLRLVYLTPPAAQEALIKFDQGEPIEPFKVYLQRPVQAYQSVGGKQKPDDRPSQAHQGTVPAERTSARQMPIRVGGPRLPNGPLATTRGRIRKFGLRQLKP